tara:strand:- start:2750 stop:3847 length:1098 start_codon:yes stop_codon:yes gene_type:complete
MENKKKIFYVTETSLPSNSANIINSLKFCDAISNYYKINFLLPKVNISNLRIKKNYDLKNEIVFFSLLNRDISSSFDRLIFCIKAVIKILINIKSIHFILSRSIMTSIILSLLNIKNVLEIHHGLSGISKILFNIIIKLPLKKKLILLVINKKLIKDLKISKLRHIVLDDGADIKKNKFISSYKYKNTCVYTGSLYRGKGLEIITHLSKIMPNIEFHVYGEKKTSNKLSKNFVISKNVKFKGFVSYSKIKEILKKYHIALMPYEKKIHARSSNLEISKYISPLKMFDYFSAGNIIFASNIKAFDHILKNNVNSFILNNTDFFSWKILINKVFRNLSDYNHIKYNALQSSKKYSWDNRAKKLLKFI